MSCPGVCGLTLGWIILSIGCGLTVDNLVRALWLATALVNTPSFVQVILSGCSHCDLRGNQRFSKHRTISNRDDDPSAGII